MRRTATDETNEQPTKGKPMAKQSDNRVVIRAPSFQTAHIEIRGIAPYMQARFSQKAQNQILKTMEQGSTAKTKKVRVGRDYDAEFAGAMHISTEGWVGIPASAIRNASIRACSTVGFKMTEAKMSVFVEADGFDEVDGEPLVKLIGDAPERSTRAVRNANGSCDMRIRPMWRQWGAKLRIRFDADQFTLQDCVNLVSRAGLQVGIGEGRPCSKNSNGIGFGLFEVVCNA